MPLQAPANVLTQTPVYRMVHIDCLDTILRRDAMHAPSCVPKDGLLYVSIHAYQTQIDRGGTGVPCGPRGVIRDYVGFYLGPKSPMLYRLHTGWNVQKVDQAKIIYLKSTAQAVHAAGLRYVFPDRHSLAAVADFRATVADLKIVDFTSVYADIWKNTPLQPDRQEKKQAEFLVYQQVPWKLVQEVGVLDDSAKAQVQAILATHPTRHQPQVLRKPSWYY